MSGQRAVQIVTAWDDRGRKFIIVDLFVVGRKCVYIESISIQKVSQFLGTVDIDILRKAKFLPDLQEPLDNLDRCEAMTGILIRRHKVRKNANQPRLVGINLDNAWL